MEDLDHRSMTAGSALSEALTEVLATDAPNILRRLGKEGISIVNGGLLELLANVPEAEMDVVSADFEHQRSIAPGWMQPESGIRLVRVKKSASELAMPVVALALALYHLVANADVVGLPIPLLKAAKAFWDNIVTLQSPQDDDAIAVVRCLAQFGAKEVLASGCRAGIDTLTLENNCGMSSDRLTVALSKLQGLGLVNATGAHQEGNSEHPKNVWSLSL